jgi:hypothetical protein
VLRRHVPRSGSYDAELLVLRDGHCIHGIEIRSVHDDMHAMGKIIRILEEEM